MDVQTVFQSKRSNSVTSATNRHYFTLQLNGLQEELSVVYVSKSANKNIKNRWHQFTQSSHLFALSGKLSQLSHPCISCLCYCLKSAFLYPPLHHVLSSQDRNALLHFTAIISTPDLVLLKSEQTLFIVKFTHHSSFTINSSFSVSNLGSCLRRQCFLGIRDVSKCTQHDYRMHPMWEPIPWCIAM